MEATGVSYSEKEESVNTRLMPSASEEAKEVAAEDPVIDTELSIEVLPDETLVTVTADVSTPALAAICALKAVVNVASSVEDRLE